jgi:hypothetical protein
LIGKRARMEAVSELGDSAMGTYCLMASLSL